MNRLRYTLLLLILAAFVPITRGAEKQTDPRIDVILWFDTEDYMLPASDDAAKRVADLLTERKVRATFKVVGEKARTLEKRSRTDVIAALKRHDIGYHSNFHSVHPTPAEYLAECALLDGIEEFVRREGPGAADVRRIFGVETLSCYGQPGSSWGPQTIAGLAQIGVAPGGVTCYVDEGNHVGMKGKPFWYCNALVVYDMLPNRTRFDLHTPGALETGKADVTKIADRLRGEGGGLISIFYHPCEWVHQQFWDGVNFSRGANPPREQWKAPPQRTEQETEAAFEKFAAYVDHIRAIPGVRWVTASDLPAMYADRARTEGASKGDLLELAKRLTDASSTGIDYQAIEGKTFSPADQFELLVRAVASAIEGKSDNGPMKITPLLGPDSAPPPSIDEDKRRIPWPAFRDAVLDVRSYLQTNGRLPARTYLGADAVPPADFLIALAAAFQHHATHLNWPTDIKLSREVALLPTRHIARDTPTLFGGWVIHKPGFRAPKILEVARLQAWTLKPAVRQ